MNTIKLSAVLCFVIILCFCLSSCTSKEAKEVIRDIDALGEITLDSFVTLQEVNSKYNELSTEDKEDIANVATLESANQQYNELKYLDLNNRIAEACSNVTGDSLSELNDLLGEYEELSEIGKTSIENYSMLEDAIIESQILLSLDMTVTIQSMANGDIDGAQSLLNEYASIMSEYQIENCLIEIGRWSSVSEAEHYLRDYLKDPNSYICYSASCRQPELQDNGTYKTRVQLEYGANNSFGASVRDEVELYVYFKVDTNTVSVSFVETELTPYYKWQFAS